MSAENPVGLDQWDNFDLDGLVGSYGNDDNQLDGSLLGGSLLDNESNFESLFNLDEHNAPSDQIFNEPLPQPAAMDATNVSDGPGDASGAV